MLRPTELQRLAIRAIKLIEDDISERFGLKVVMGAELEFVVRLTKAYSAVHPNMYSNPLSVVPEKFDSGYLPSNQKSGREKAKYFPDSPYISSFVQEINSGQYEIVFSHRAKHGSPVVLARAIESTQRRLKKAEGDGSIESILLDSVVREREFNNTANSLQPNVSMVTDSGYNVFSGIDKAQTTFVSNRVINVLNETLLMTAPDNSFYKRFTLSRSSSAPEAFVARGDELSVRGESHNIVQKYLEPSLSRLEIRTPGADSDPYMAVLVAMICIHHILLPNGKEAFDKIKERFNLDDFPAEGGKRIPIPKNIHDSARRFEDGHILRDMLNSLSGEERLGDRLHEAVLEHVRRRGSDIGEGMGRG